MKRDSIIRLFFVLTFILATGIFISPSVVPAAVMGDYCQSPPFISSVAPPNIMLLVDASGSMGDLAYKTKPREGEHHYRCSNNLARHCDHDTDCSHKYCDNDPGEGCHDSNDCEDHGSCVTPAPGGVCQEQSATTVQPYGYCSNDLTRACGQTNVPNTDCVAPGTCIPRQSFEGYFSPEKSYFQNTTDQIYYEESGTTCTVKYEYTCSNNQNQAKTCTQVRPGDAYNICSAPKTWYCAKGTSHTYGDCGTEKTGNWLNYQYMSRIDLVRWAMTGGTPKSCGSSSNQGTTSEYCDPREWNGHGTGTKVASACSNTQQINTLNTVQGGCVLQTNGSVKVAVPWTRVYDGLVFQFAKLAIKPRMGAMFSDSTQVKSNRVFLGDFTGPNSNSYQTFQNLLTQVNVTSPSGYTPTGPLMWAALNYYSQKNSQDDSQPAQPDYNGFDVQSGSGDKWKNPMYDCPDQGGSNCKFIRCAKNFVLLMSDGLWNRGDKPVTSSCDINDGYELNSADPVVPAYQMHKGFTNVKAEGDPPPSSKVSGVYTVGLFVSVEGQKTLENTALYGSFDNTSKTWPSNRTTYPGMDPLDQKNCSITTTNAMCPSNLGTGSNCTPVPASSIDWDKNADGVADTFYYAEDANAIRNKILEAVLDMLSKVTSGTAASVLASGEGSGANIAQAIYYPRRSFVKGAVDWAGGLQNFWYYVDPQFVNSNIREEGGTRDYVLDLLADNNTEFTKDFVLKFEYNREEKKTYANRFLGLGNGGVGTQLDTVEFESLGNIWEAGKLLWARDPSTRAIYTPLDTTQVITASANQFSVSNLTALRPLLNTDASTAVDPSTDNNTLATNIINWVRGTDFAEGFTQTYTTGSEMYRRRTVAVDSTTDPATGELIQHEWKLGDIIDSTPRISSWVPLHYYDKTYKDYTYTNFVTDVGSTLALDAPGRYRNRGMIFVGANDGMLHAFKLGRLGLQWKSQTISQKATLKYCSGNKSIACNINSDCGVTGTCTYDTDLGQEIWSFIPKNVLPYLKYIKENDYCHLYTVDLTPYLFDASIGVPTGCTGDYWTCSKSASTWRTVLIGGMRYGGACRKTTTVCSDVNGDGVKDCVNTPLNDPADSTKGFGYSSYFALDITNPESPKLMWEFTDDQLGFTTTGPALLRISSRTASGSTSTPDPNAATNGRWFVVLGSGPTGPIDTADSQFMGRSDQNMRLFVLDLKTGVLQRTIDSGIQYAFAGSMLNATHDSDFDYQDNAVYIGYAKRTSSSPYTWTDGGVLRLLTREDLSGSTLTTTGACTASMTALNPNCWVFGRVLDGIGPVSSSVVRLQEPGGNLWLYAGTGRYFYKNRSGTDDASGQRHLIGAKDPCFLNGSYKTECMDTTNTNSSLEPSGTVLGLSDLDTVNLSVTTGVTATKGWKILLDPAGTYTDGDAERVITDPLASVSGLVYFTTFMPYDSPCTTGGTTALWAVKYNTAEAGGALLKGKALIQVSTGSIEQVDLASAFTQKGQRKTTDMEGVPPTAQGLSLIAAPPPVKRVLHMKER